VEKCLQESFANDAVRGPWMRLAGAHTPLKEIEMHVTALFPGLDQAMQGGKRVRIQ
jgi:hypothetical protein